MRDVTITYKGPLSEVHNPEEGKFLRDVPRLASEAFADTVKAQDPDGWEIAE
jgi:hypothetical protein